MSIEQHVGNAPIPHRQQSDMATASAQNATAASQSASDETQGDANKEGVAEGSEKKKEGKKLEEFVSLAWKGLLFFGGIFMLIFFVQVGFFPDLKLTDLTATLAAVSLTGLLMLVIFAGSFVVPAVMARRAFARLNDAQGVVLMAAFAGAMPARAFCLSLLQTATWWRAIEWILYGLALVLGALAYRTHIPKRDEPANFDASVENGRVQYHKSVLRAATQGKRFGGPLLEVLWVALVFFFGQIIAPYYFAITYHSTDSSNQTLMFFAWPLICFAANIALLSPERADEKRWWRDLVVTAGVLLLIFLSLTGASSLISESIARRLALGYISDAVVTLSKQGCEVAEASSGGAMTCRFARANAPGVVCPVTIVSRIGSEVVLQPMKSNFQVVVKSADVLGWARTAPPAIPSGASGVEANGPKQGSNEPPSLRQPLRCGGCHSPSPRIIPKLRVHSPARFTVRSYAICQHPRRNKNHRAKHDRANIDDASARRLLTGTGNGFAARDECLL